MLTRDYGDIGCGVLLCVIGLAVALHSLTNYALGTFSQMGTGMFPMALGLILVFLGSLIAIPAFFRAGELARIDARPALAVIIALSSFPLVLPTFGFIPAVAVTVLLSTLAEERLTTVQRIALVVAICAITYVIFILGFRLPVTIIRIPS